MGAPNILLIEDRHEQSVLFQLNLQIYLGGSITTVKSKEAIQDILSKNPNEFQLIVATSILKNEETKPTLNTVENLPPVIYLDSKSEYKSVIKESAKILAITPQQMVQLEVPKNFPIPIHLFEFLIYFPITITHRDENSQIIKEFAGGDAIDKTELQSLISSGVKYLYIDSFERLKFANSYSEQISTLSEKLRSKEVSLEERIALVDNTSQMISKIYNESGMQAEVSNLANSCAESMLLISESVNSLNELQDHLLKNKLSYRFIHSQLILYIGIKSLELLDWLDKEKSHNFALAAFYHDIVLLTDEEAMIHSEKELNDYSGNDEVKERIKYHGKLSYELLNATEGIHYDVKTIVREHHGSQLGIGYSNEVSQLGDLSKLFIIVEEWTDLLFEHHKKDIEFDVEKNKNNLKVKYIDLTTLQIIETLQYIDHEELVGLYNKMIQKYDDNAVEKTIKPDESNDSNEKEMSNDDVIKFLNDKVDPSSEIIQKFGRVSFYEEIIRVQGLNSNDFNNEEKIIISGVTQTVEEAKKVIRALENGSSSDNEKVTRLTELEEKIDEVIKIAANSPALPNIIKKPAKPKVDTITDLMKVCKYGTVELVESFLASDAELIKIDKFGRNCLHHAAMGGNIPVMEWLIHSKRINKNILDSQRKSPIFFTVINNQIKAFNYLLSIDARIQQQATGGINIGMLAARLGFFDIVKIAINKGLRVRTTDYKSKNIIDYAKAGKHLEIVDYLEIALTKELEK